MADVYLAEDVTLHRRVALKIMLDVLTDDASFKERFRREAQTVARLDHSYIVQVYSTGQTSAGQPYIAMQYIDGGSLLDRLKRLAERGKLAPTAQALSIIRQVAVALGVAHRADIVHRDLKPANILLRPDGTPVLVDLGIASVQGGQRLTQTGNLIGTPNYMSPEQVRGQPLDGRSDLYSLGIILYELLAGKRPFEADESIAVLHKHVYEPPPPLRDIRPDLSAVTLHVVETCLQKEPNMRYSDAAALVSALDHALQVEAGGTPVQQTTTWRLEPLEKDLLSRRQVLRQTDVPRRLPRPLLLVGLIGLLLLAVGGAWMFGLFSATEDTAVETIQFPTRIGAEEGETAVSQPNIAHPTSTMTNLPTLTPLSPPTHTPASPLTPTDLPPTFMGADGRLMRLVPAGPFIMGSTAVQVDEAIAHCLLHPEGGACAQAEFGSEMPQHTVTLSAFYMDEVEVTNNAYRACVAARGCDLPDAGSGSYSRDTYYQLPEFNNYPVVYVSWLDARSYCTWAGKRLPTEAEWEKGARGEDGRLFPWGNTFDPALTNTQDRGQEFLLPVGQFPVGASPYGLLDMAGNVWEYTADWFAPDYYSTSPNVDPTGPSASPTGERVLRSGSYANYQHYARTANRGFVTPTSSTAFRGIRCVLSATN